MSAQTIYNLLIGSGLSQAGALGVMGNWQCESGLEPNRLQGDFSSYRTLSKDYVSRLNSGKLTRATFSTDSKGFGLAQWTYYTRKAAMYDAWKASGMAIDSDTFQVKFAMREFVSDYSALLEFLKTTTDLYAATSRVCKEYERPAVNNIDARFYAAKRLMEDLDLDAKGETPAESGDTAPPAETYWPPRMICKGMSGDDVAVLQALLKARGYAVAIDGNFSSDLHNVTVAFQRANSLDADGIVGPLTWGKLLEK